MLYQLKVGAWDVTVLLDCRDPLRADDGPVSIIGKCKRVLMRHDGSKRIRPAEPIEIVALYRVLGDGYRPELAEET